MSRGRESTTVDISCLSFELKERVETEWEEGRGKARVDWSGVEGWEEELSGRDRRWMRFEGNSRGRVREEGRVKMLSNALCRRSAQSKRQSGGGWDVVFHRSIESFPPLIVPLIHWVQQHQRSEVIYTQNKKTSRMFLLTALWCQRPPREVFIGHV